jgi:hypothetical protein
MGDFATVEKVDRSKKSFDEQSKSFDKDSLIDRLVEWLYNPQTTAVRGLFGLETRSIDGVVLTRDTGRCRSPRRRRLRRPRRRPRR